MKISELVPGTTQFFPEAEFKPLEEAIDNSMTLLDFRTYETEKGMGVCILANDGSDMIKIYTHAKAIIRIFAENDMNAILEQTEEPITFTVKRGRNARGTYFYLE